MMLRTCRYHLTFGWDNERFVDQLLDSSSALIPISYKQLDDLSFGRSILIADITTNAPNNELVPANLRAEEHCLH